MNKARQPRRRVVPNTALRRELIEKGFVTPPALVPERLRMNGFTEAAKEAANRYRYGRLYQG